MKKTKKPKTVIKFVLFRDFTQRTLLILYVLQLMLPAIHALKFEHNRRAVY